MAVFSLAFEQVLADEGGYKLTNIFGDAGGMTYAGISRRSHPDWEGWLYVDKNQSVPDQLVKNFYQVKFWNDISGDQIVDQKIAANIFNFYVNAGNPAKTLAQKVVSVNPDGIFGPQTIKALNQFNSEQFLLVYTLSKISFYASICNRNRDQTKFLLGWVNRALRF